MPQKKSYWTTAKAIEKAAQIGVEVSLPTLIKWCQSYNLGYQLGGKGGKWYIYPEPFTSYIKSGKINYGTIETHEDSESTGSGTESHSA